VIAKGARGAKGKFGSSLQPMSHVLAVLYKHDHRELHLISQCDLLTRFRKLAEDLEKFTSAMSVIEIVNYVAHDEERNDQLFELVLGALKAIDDCEKNAINVQFHFELHLSDVLGFRPSFHRCLSCNRSLDEQRVGTNGGKLRLGNGGVLCEKCSGRGSDHGTISFGALKVLQRLQDTKNPVLATQVRLTGHQKEEVGGILRRYLQSHVGGLNRLKVQSVAASIV
jgi:DNA repair protein RecO